MRIRRTRLCFILICHWIISERSSWNFSEGVPPHVLCLLLISSPAAKNQQARRVVSLDMDQVQTYLRAIKQVPIPHSYHYVATKCRN